MLVLNFPGIFVPPVPGKKLVGNKDFKFILERRYYLGKLSCFNIFLERFFLKLSSRPYLINSPEFQVFIRPKLDAPKN